MKRMTKKEFKKVVKQVWADAKETKSGVINLTLLIDERREGSVLEYSNIDNYEE